MQSRRRAGRVRAPSDLRDVLRAFVMLPERSDKQQQQKHTTMKFWLHFLACGISPNASQPKGCDHRKLLHMEGRHLWDEAIGTITLIIENYYA